MPPNRPHIPPRYALLTLFIILIAKQCWVSLAVTPFANHDEPAHFAYVQYLVEERRLPVFSEPYRNPFELSYSTEYGQVQLAIDAAMQNNQKPYSLTDKINTINAISGQLGSPSRHPLSVTDEPAAFATLKYQLPPGQLYKNSATFYSPLYYLVEVIPYAIFYQASILTRLLAMRIFSVLFVLITVYCCYRLARRLTDSFNFAFAVAAIIGFLPIYSYVAAGVNNDAALTACGAATVWCGLLLIDRLKLKTILILGVMLGFGLLSKPQFAALAFASLFPFVYHFVRRDVPVKRIFLFLLALVAVAVVIAGWWYFRNLNLYGNFLGPTSQTNVTVNHLHLQFGTVLYLMFIRYAYAFLTFFFNATFTTKSGPPIIADVIGGITIVSGFILFIYYWLKERANRFSSAFAQFLFLIICAACLEATYLFLFLQNVFTKGTYTFPVEGRYFYPVMACLMIPWLWGLWKLVPARYRLTLTAATVSGTLLALVWIVTRVLVPGFNG